MTNYNIKRGDYWHGPTVTLQLTPGTDMASAVIKCQLRRTPAASSVAHDFVTAANINVVVDASAGTIALTPWLPVEVTTLLKGLYYSDIQVGKAGTLNTTTIFDFTVTLNTDVSR